MLNMRRLGEFKYDIREVLNNKQLDPAFMQTFLASVIAKASRQGIVDAKAYVRDVEKEGALTKDISDNICYLLDRYTKYQSQAQEA
ncbi:MAG TPA: hypothetical protein VLH13_01700 [Methanomassiliicoccales archaeon]|nr:hypothetical protein [Methanomassiliicoccales archaeon]